MILRRVARAACAAGVLAGACLAPAAAAASSPAVSFEPALPTWYDSVVMTVEGTSTTACGEAGVRATTPMILQYQSRIEVAVEEHCASLAPPVAQPYRLTIALGNLLPDRWTIVLTDSSGMPRSHALQVYSDGSLDVDFPPLVRAGEPFTVRVRGIAVCSLAHASASATISPGLIEIVAGAACLPITNPPGGPFDRTVQIPALPAGDYEVRAFDYGYLATLGNLRRSRLRVWDPAGCLPSDTALCLRGGRFRVEASWRDFAGQRGTAHAQPLAGDDGTGLLWFFSPDNAELTLKVLDGCTFNQRWWVFVASASTVEYEVVVTDTLSGRVARYHKSLGATPSLIPDTNAFATCAGAG